ncbi:MAG: glycosyltransferase family 4 protein [Flavobacteriia bacterium]|nr:glycosyltransferase family 4 protein [Flavobacteriia bacterium]
MVFIDSLGSGGAQRQLVQLAKGFQENGHEVEFLVYHDLNFFSSEVEALSIPIHLVSSNSSWKRVWKIRRFIRQGGYNVILSFLEVPNLLNVLSSLPFKNYKTYVGERSANPAIKTSFKKKLVRWPLILADGIVANSYSNVELLNSSVPFLSTSKQSVIYNSIDMSLWNPPIDYKFSAEKIQLIVAASHQYLKNASGLIQALQLLGDERERITIKWYGEESPDNSFKEALELRDELNLQSCIEFHPATREIQSVMMQADAVGLFSHYEGFPNVICEAMSLAKPVLVSNISDMPRLLGEEHPLTFNPSDPSSIAKSIKFMLSMTESELREEGQKNRSLAEMHFDKTQVVRQYLDLMQS